jgi:hypothetical protein
LYKQVLYEKIWWGLRNNIFENLYKGGGGGVKNILPVILDHVVVGVSVSDAKDVGCDAVARARWNEVLDAALQKQLEVELWKKKMEAEAYDLGTETES